MVQTGTNLTFSSLFLSLFLSLLCFSQPSWARALWIVTLVKALGSPWISGSFCTDRRWELVTSTKVPKYTHKKVMNFWSTKAFCMDLGVRSLPPSPCYCLSAWRHLLSGVRYLHLPILSTRYHHEQHGMVRVARSCTVLCYRSWIELWATSEAIRCLHISHQAWLLANVSMRSALTDSWQWCQEKQNTKISGIIETSK